MEIVERQFEAIGTHWHIQIFERLEPSAESLLFETIHERIAAFDKAYSRFRPDSLVSEIARSPGTYTLPPDAAPMIEMYRLAYNATNGLVTPLIGQVLADTGYDAEYSFAPKTPTTPPAWDDAIAFHDPILTVREPVLLDFGAAGKGYLIDIVAKLISDHGIRSYCVDAGGDMYYEHHLHTPLRVGLEDPTDATKVIGVATIGNESICGSAGNRRQWHNYHHIIHPTTLESPRHIAAVWVIAKTTMLADILTTCLFFVEANSLTTKFNFEYTILYSDFSVVRSPRFPGEFFTT